MTGRIAPNTLATALFVLTAGLAQGQEPAPDSDKPPCGICRVKDEIRKQLPWLELGADLRLRLSFAEANKLDKEADGHDELAQVHRARLWASIEPISNLKFNLRVVTEPRYYCRPDKDEQFCRQEVLFDRLNVRVSNVFGLPVAVTLGRQDIALGDGWLIHEGTPSDGSRTLFFDAVRLTAELKDWQTTADVVWIDNHANSSEWIRPFDDQDIALSEQDEQGAIVHVSNRSLANTRIDGYFIYKREHNPSYSNGREGETYTFGGMLKSDLDEHWDVYIEMAPQFGHAAGANVCAFGADSRLCYSFRDRASNALHLQYEYLSGGRRPETGFQKPWGRYSPWSDIYNGAVDTLDGRSKESSNLHRIGLGWSAKPCEKTGVLLNYHLLFADDHLASAGTGALSKGGHFRGQLVTGELSYRHSEHLSTRVNAEAFFPGDYYNSTHNDVAVWVRYEVMLTW